MVISQQLRETVVKSIMENFPEASSGCALACIGWKYDDWKFTFLDEETGKTYKPTKDTLLSTLDRVVTADWPKGCTQPPARWDEETADEWLCNCDATDFDAFAQLACLGEVIYG